MSSKDVYFLRLGFHGVCDIRVNIPNLYDLPAFWQANYRIDDSIIHLGGLETSSLPSPTEITNHICIGLHTCAHTLGINVQQIFECFLGVGEAFECGFGFIGKFARGDNPGNGELSL